MLCRDGFPRSVLPQDKEKERTLCRLAGEDSDVVLPSISSSRWSALQPNLTGACREDIVFEFGLMALYHPQRLGILCDINAVAALRPPSKNCTFCLTACPQRSPGHDCVYMHDEAAEHILASARSIPCKRARSHSEDSMRLVRFLD